MTRVEQVDNDIWHDPPFCDLAPGAKLVYLWSFLNPLCPMSGLYKVRPAQIELDTGLVAETIGRALAELETHGMVRYEHGVLWCCARASRLRARNPGIAKSIARDVAALPSEHPFRVAFLDRYAADTWLRDELRPLLPATLSEPFADGSGTVSDSPVVEGQSGTVPGPSPDGPMQLHMQGSSRTDENARPAREAAEDDIWSHYLATFHPDGRGMLPSFDEKRRKIVVAALAVRDPEQCKRAITGLSRSPHHNGANEQGVKYLDIRHALRGNGLRGETHEERVDRMAALADGPPLRPGERAIVSVADLLAAEQDREP